MSPLRHWRLRRTSSSLQYLGTTTSTTSLKPSIIILKTQKLIPTFYKEIEIISITRLKPCQQQVSRTELPLLPFVQKQPWLFKSIPHVLQGALHVTLIAAWVSWELVTVLQFSPPLSAHPRDTPIQSWRVSPDILPSVYECSHPVTWGAIAHGDQLGSLGRNLTSSSQTQAPELQYANKAQYP